MHKFLSFFRQKISGFSLGKIIVLSLFFGHVCFAGDKNSDTVEAIIQILDIVFSMISALLTPAVILAGWLLSPDWTMGDFFGLRKYFLQVWILVSNLVYIAFALILLFLAVMQIFGGEGTEFTLKNKLPQFLVGILMVPFTWLIVSWTLSFANQATAAVLSIPMGAIGALETGSPDDKDKGMFHEKVIPTTITMDLTKNGQNKTEEIDCKTVTGPDDKKCISAAEFVTKNQSGPFFIMMVYAYDIFRVQKTAIVELTNKCDKNLDAKNCIKELTDVLIKFGTSLIVTFFFGILTIALCWVLLMRAFKLWIYIMFSPLFGLAVFSGNGLSGAFESEGGGGGGHGDSGLSSLGFKPFFKLAMVPVMVSAVLSFGLLFIGAIDQTFSSANMTATNQQTKEICTEEKGYMVKYCITPHASTNEESAQEYSSKLIIGTNREGYAITFQFGDMFSGFVGENGNNTVGGIAGGMVDSVESIFAHIILTLIALVIIWMGVKTAVSYDKVTEVAFAPFAKLGDSVQHFVAHLPSHIPLPHPAFQALTPGGMTAVADSIRNAVDTSQFEKNKSMREKFANPGLIGLESAAKSTTTSLNEFNNRLKDTSVANRNTSTGINAQKIRLTSIVEGSTIQNKSQIINEIKGANTSSELNTIIEKHELVKNITDPASQENFRLVKEGAQTASSGGSTGGVFSGATMDNDGKIRGLKQNTTTSTIGANDLNPAQQAALKDPQNIQALKNPLVSEKRKKLKELGFNIPDSLPDAKVQELATNLLK